MDFLELCGVIFLSIILINIIISIWAIKSSGSISGEEIRILLESHKNNLIESNKEF